MRQQYNFVPKGIRDREDSELTLNLWRLDESCFSEGWLENKEEEIDFEKGEGKIFEFRQVYTVFQW